MQGSKEQRAFKAWTNQARRKTGNKGESARMCACNLYPCINNKTATHALTAKAKSLLFIATGKFSANSEIFIVNIENSLLGTASLD